MITTRHQLGIHTTLIVLSLLGCVSIVKSAVGFQQDSLAHLIEAVESAEVLSQEAALIEIRELGPGAKDAIIPVCKLLSSDNFSLRALSVDALVSMGEPSIEPVRKLLKSESALARAAAIQCLTRLSANQYSELKRLADDHSERVRASVAIGLSNCKHPESDSLIIQLLKDSKPAVCIQACLAIQKRKSNPEKVVPALAKNLDRIKVAAVVIETLGTYGTDAKSALPKMFETSSQIREWDEHFNHPIDEALSHIGPPDSNDVKSIGSLLLGTKHETNIRIAQSLALLGREGSAAADDLERVIDEMLQQFAEFDPESPRFDKKHSNFEPWQLEEIVRDIELTIVACAAALWEVTGDADRFTKIAIKISLGSEWGMFFYSPTPWETFTKSDVLEIKKLLDSKDSRILECGIQATQGIGKLGYPFINRVIEIHRGNSYKYKKATWEALAAMGPAAAEKTIPVLLKDLRDQKLSHGSFASLLQVIGVCPPECRQELLKAFENNDEWVSRIIANLLCKSCKNSPAELDAVYKLFMLAIEDFQLKSKEVVEAFQLLPSTPNYVLNFYIKCLADSDAAARIAAADALGELGPKAESALPALNKLLSSIPEDVPIRAAKAIYQITGDVETFRKFIDTELRKQNRLSVCLKLIAELGPQGVPFQDFVYENQEYYTSGQIDDYCEILQSLASDKSIAKLQELSKSKDWKMQSAAKSALNKLTKTKTSGTSK